MRNVWDWFSIQSPMNIFTADCDMKPRFTVYILHVLLSLENNPCVFTHICLLKDMMALNTPQSPSSLSTILANSNRSGLQHQHHRPCEKPAGLLTDCISVIYLEMSCRRNCFILIFIFARFCTSVARRNKFTISLYFHTFKINLMICYLQRIGKNLHNVALINVWICNLSTF